MHKHVTISVDGEHVSLCGEHATVYAVLTASGLDAARYDLCYVLPDGSSVTVPGDSDLTLREGDEYITARISTTTA